MVELERRVRGQDRRIARSTEFCGLERRRSDRRQMSIEEISFREWATHLVYFKQHLVRKQQRRAEREARRRQEKQAKLGASCPSGDKSKS